VKQPLVSVITVCYNAESTIGKTLKSVHEQTYPNVEHIVQDGASTDGTVEIVHSFNSQDTRFVSEKDSGIYNALNRAIDRAEGRFVALL
jgi:glycosyltransferase involved in cell wall biosynthesis